MTRRCFGSERPGQAIVEKAEPQVEIIRFFVVPKRFGALKNVFQKSGIQAEVFQFVPPQKKVCQYCPPPKRFGGHYTNKLANFVSGK